VLEALSTRRMIIRSVPSSPPVIERRRQIGCHAQIFALISTENFTNAFSHVGSFYVKDSLVERLILLVFLRAEPLCMAKWSVLSLLIKYCGSSFEAWTVYPLNVISEVIFP
jgi:hypothetical protein